MSFVFDPDDPFPLWPEGVEYEVEKTHATQVDAWLGLRTAEVEHHLIAHRDRAVLGNASREFWIGTSVQTFSTPYTELRSILEDLKPSADDVVVDLGAGYGRFAHVLARHAPGTSFIGYEIVPERQREGLRVFVRQGLSRASLIVGDVTQLDFAQARGTVYFLYDFGSREDVEITVENLKKRAEFQGFSVVARGGRSREVIEKQHPWLSQVVKPLHRSHYSIYRSR